MPKIYAVGDPAIPPDAVLVQRPGRWGNPFIIGRDGTREQVCFKHAAWLPTQVELMAALGELKGRDLVCCKDRPCHAETLLAYANRVEVEAAPSSPHLEEPPPPPPFKYTGPLVPTGIDSETELILPGLLTPPLICVSTAVRSPSGTFDTNLMTRDEGVSFYRQVLLDPSKLIVIHNARFDLGVACVEDVSLIPLVFDAFENNRICCTITLQKLIDVGRGMRKFRRIGNRVTKATYALSELIAMYYGERVEKEDTWRMHYGLLKGFPLADWPPAAKHYAIEDAVLHLRLWEAQQRVIRDVFGGTLPDQAPQQRAAWALYLMSMWGIRADAVEVEKFIAHCQNEIAKMEEALKGSGILKGEWKCRGECRYSASIQWIGPCPKCGKANTCTRNPNAGSRTMSEIHDRVAKALTRMNIAVPMTDPSSKFPYGQVKADEDTLRLTDDPKLHALADALTFQKHLGQWGPVLKAAVERPVCCSYNELVDNGRTSCSGDKLQKSSNIQNPPRRGEVRGCIKPRDGWVFVSTDADTIELRALAQNTLEMCHVSRMADVIKRQFHDGGPDLHVVLAAGGLRISEDEAHRLHLADDVAFATARQLYKHVNFALAGGAGAKTFALMARGFGLRLADNWDAEVARASELKSVWLATWPEMREYFRIIGKMTDSGKDSLGRGRGTIIQAMSGRIRADCTFTAAANSFFSGRVADAMKEILWKLAIECYTGRCTSKHQHGGWSSLCTHEGRTVLYGSRPALFLHDEPILEHPEDGTESDRAERQRVIVVDTLNVWMKDVPCTSSAVMMRRWHKNAKGLKVDGKTVPVRPEKVVGSDGREKVKWVHDTGETVHVDLADKYDVENTEIDVVDSIEIENVA